jgi:blocked-early-in-transport protein 1
MYIKKTHHHNPRYGGGHLHQRDARSQLFDNAGGSSYGYGYGYPGDGRGGSASPRVASAYRPATPNARGQYSASVLEELESQNDAQVEGLSAKVKMLKDVGSLLLFYGLFWGGAQKKA